MPDPSNPTLRVMQVLNFLAAHPTEAFTLAEIARAVGLSNGSAHRLLTTMAAAQFLSRNERHRTYSLGVALVAVGQAAVEKHRGIDIARREIARVAVEMNNQCSVNAVVDGDIVVLAKEGASQTHTGLTRVGERRPLMPPSGLCHVAWGGPDAIDAYLDRAGPHLGPHLRERVLAALPVIRARGFAMAGAGAHFGQDREAMLVPEGGTRDQAFWDRVQRHVAAYTPEEIQLLDMAEVSQSGISYMAAPVFAPDGAVAFAIVMSGLPARMPVDEIEALSARLCATAAAITNETRGKRPSG